MDTAEKGFNKNFWQDARSLNTSVLSLAAPSLWGLLFPEYVTAPYIKEHNDIFALGSPRALLKFQNGRPCLRNACTSVSFIRPIGPTRCRRNVVGAPPPAVTGSHAALNPTYRGVGVYYSVGVRKTLLNPIQHQTGSPLSCPGIHLGATVNMTEDQSSKAILAMALAD